MPTPLLIGAGSGLVSAALFASAATATALAGVLFYLAPLPLCLAGLGWGGMAALFSALTGTVVIAASSGPGHGRHLRPFDRGADRAPHASRASVASAPSPQGRQMNAVEWYPAGRIVGWAALIAGALAGILVLILGYDQEAIARSIRQMFSTAHSRSSTATARCSPRKPSPTSRP